MMIMQKERIPKTIHYCWFGSEKIPEKLKKNISLMKKMNPDFKIMKWNESNFNVNHNYFTQLMSRQKKWAFISDYVRLYVLKKYGGFYFDTDVEPIKPIDSKLLECDSFVAQEDIDLIATGLGCGASKNQDWINDLLKIYDEFSRENKYIENRTCVEITTRYFNGLGFSKNKIKPINIEGVTIFPERFFCPQTPGTKKVVLTNDTYMWHHYEYSWRTSKLNKSYTIFVKNNVRHFIVNMFGRKFYYHLRELYRKVVRGI